MIGSAARRSARTVAAINTAAATNTPPLGTDSQGHACPPCNTPKITALPAHSIRPAPA